LTKQLINILVSVSLHGVRHFYLKNINFVTGWNPKSKEGP
jgi:hypothetical protein